MEKVALTHSWLMASLAFVGGKFRRPTDLEAATVFADCTFPTELWLLDLDGGNYLLTNDDCVALGVQGCKFNECNRENRHGIWLLAYQTDPEYLEYMQR